MEACSLEGKFGSLVAVVVGIEVLEQICACSLGLQREMA